MCLKFLQHWIGYCNNCTKSQGFLLVFWVGLQNKYRSISSRNSQKQLFHTLFSNRPRKSDLPLGDIDNSLLIDK